MGLEQHGLAPNRMTSLIPHDYATPRTLSPRLRVEQEMEVEAARLKEFDRRCHHAADLVAVPAANHPAASPKMADLAS